MPKNNPTKKNEKKYYSDLPHNISEQMNIHTKDAEVFLTTFTDTVSDSLASGEPVRLSGSGVIDVNHVAAWTIATMRLPVCLTTT